ncbi:hypothetical protein AAF712_004621 [Marasmius tenuissimus]|uniref:F-box domain-containing protein n=1 Tax=Marasmius tenuissimus TaxID=585030 RepID=A0ABR3A4G0_9AGAR
MAPALINTQAAETKILELEEAISRNRLEYQKLTAEHAALKNSISPLLRPHDDILYLVFDIAATQYSVSDRYPDRYSLTDRLAPLWVLSQTCRRLRNVALSNPSLWSYFAIHRRAEYFPKDPVSMMKTWLARSQPVPLKGKVHFEGYKNEEELLELLDNECHRWLELRFDVDDQVDLYYSFATKRVSFPLLRSLEVMVIRPHSSTNYPAIRESLQAPNLTHASTTIYTEYGSLTRRIPAIPLPWHQLTHYGCGHYPDEEFFAIVPKLVKLHSLVFQVEYELPLSPNAPHRILPNLRSVEWKGGSVRAAIALMSRVTLSVVERVVLHSYDSAALRSDEVVDSLGQAIASLQHRSSCRIQELAINAGALNFPKSPRLSLPTVRILRLIFSLGST